jgi:hypothetical protein
VKITGADGRAANPNQRFSGGEIRDGQALQGERLVCRPKYGGEDGGSAIERLVLALKSRWDSASAVQVGLYQNSLGGVEMDRKIASVPAFYALSRLLHPAVINS